MTIWNNLRVLDRDWYRSIKSCTDWMSEFGDPAMQEGFVRTLRLVDDWRARWGGRRLCMNCILVLAKYADCF